MESLLDLIKAPLEHRCRKHELSVNADAYAEDQINHMSNVELLEAISLALSETYVQDCTCVRGGPHRNPHCQVHGIYARFTGIAK